MVLLRVFDMDFSSQSNLELIFCIFGTLCFPFPHLEQSLLLSMTKLVKPFLLRDKKVQAEQYSIVFPSKFSYFKALLLGILATSSGFCKLLNFRFKYAICVNLYMPLSELSWQWIADSRVTKCGQGCLILSKESMLAQAMMIQDWEEPEQPLIWLIILKYYYQRILMSEQHTNYQHLTYHLNQWKFVWQLGGVAGVIGVVQVGWGCDILLIKQEYNKMNQDHQQVLKKHQFQIRKVPLRRFIPEKTPELYAMDAHSICLPSKIKRKQQWGSLYSEANYCNYEEQFNQQIVSSQAYKQLYSRYLKLRDQRLKQKSELQTEIRAIETNIALDKEKQEKLTTTRDELYTEIEGLRSQLAECKEKNYNLRWQLYNQRGARYANLYGYSFLEPNQLTYEQLLQMEEQIGSVSRGLTLQQIEKLDRRIYECSSGQERQICCICYDEIQEQEWVTVLKCSHTHHCDCIKDWLIKQKICPICKKEVIISPTLQDDNKDKIEGVSPVLQEIINPESQ